MSRMAMCPRCHVPLISTLAFSRAEFYCLECAQAYGFFEPVGAAATPELDAEHARLRAEWDAHVGDRLLVNGSRLPGCEWCVAGRGCHPDHASTAERAAHAAALEWLTDRAGRSRAEAEA